MVADAVADVDSMAVGQLKRVVVRGVAVCIARAHDGEFYAVDDTCSHADASLSNGWTADMEIECPMHNAMFDLETGEPTSLPATESIRTYAVSVQDGQVHLDVSNSRDMVPHSRNANIG